MDAFELSEVVAEHSRLGQPYFEFLRESNLSLGLYVLRAEQPDPQLPHTEDEVYYIVSGNGTIQVGQEHRSVSKGSLVFVGQSVEHRFHSITQDLTILVFFSPPRRSRAVAE